MAFTTSPARISPATAGTKAVEPGTGFSPEAPAAETSAGSSRDYTTLTSPMPRLRHSRRTTLASGQTVV